jgi:hypothetical protein
MWLKNQKGSTRYTAVDNPCFGENDLLALQKYTDEYMKKKGGLEIERADERLQALIDCSKYWIHAFLSCAHLLSREATRKYLVEILQYVKSNDQCRNYLSIVIYVSKLNPPAISREESDRAKAIFNLLDFQDGYETCLPYIKTILQQDVDETLFVDNEMKMQGLTANIWRSAISYLDGMKTNPKLWVQAISYTGWMSDLLKFTDKPIDLSLIDKSFPDWRAWALWSPNRPRLLWMAQLRDQHVEPLIDLLALEGPDFKLNKNPKLLYSAIKKGANTRIVNGAVKFDDGGFGKTPEDIIDTAFELYETSSALSEEAFKLFTSAILKGVHELENTLKVLDVAFANSSIGAERLLSLERVYAARNTDDRFMAIKDVLPVLEDTVMKDVKTEIVRYIGAVLNGKAFTLLDTIRNNFAQNKTLSTVEIVELDVFKSFVFKHSWLEEYIFGRRWQTIKFTPSTNMLHALFDVSKWISEGKGDKFFKSLLNRYYKNKLCGHGSLNQEHKTWIEEFLGFWMTQPTVGRRQLALRSADWKFLLITQKIDLLHSIDAMNDHDCETLLAVTARKTEMSIVNFARFIASGSQMKNTERLAWTEVLNDMICEHAQTIVSWTALHLSLSIWTRWLRDIRVIFGTDQSGRQPSILFSNDLHNWAKQLERISTSNLQKLNECLEVGPALSNILLCSQHRARVLSLLDHLAVYRRSEMKEFYTLTFTKIPLNHDTIPKLWNLVSRLYQASETEAALFQRFVYLSSNASSTALVGIVASYLTQYSFRIDDPGFNASDIALLRTLLPYFIKSDTDLSDSLSEATIYLDHEYNQILLHMARIHAIKIALKLHNTEKTSNLLYALGLEDDRSMLEIPDHLVDVVEQINYFEYEICFPLDHLKPLQKIALCVGDARNIVLRINLQHGIEKPLYCVHLDPDAKTSANIISSSEQEKNNDRDHVYWDQETFQDAPDHHHCYGQPNITASQVYRIVRRLMKNGLSSVEELYEAISADLKSLASSCYSCGAYHGVKRYRSVLCSASSCSSFQLDPTLQFANFNADVYDILLMGVQNAATLNRLEFLSGCPLKTQTQLSLAVSKLPNMNVIAKSHDKHKVISALGSDALELLSWLSRFPGFITEASGSLKIPSMPGVRQFVLASSSTEVEASRAVHYTPQAHTQVVFHGTSADRLFPILYEGLRIGSGTNLQRIGASLGNGVYCATEPSTALSYAYTSSAWGNSIYGGMRILLGCELVGHHSLASTGIYVIPDATVVSVRYIFLFPPSIQAPISRHIAPALQSAFSLLRSGLA